MRWVLMIKGLIGQRVSCAVKRPIARYQVIRKVPTGGNLYRPSTPVSITDSFRRLITRDQRLWRGRSWNVFDVEVVPQALLRFQTE